MSDATKCYGDGCSAKADCVRYTAVASPYQSYFSAPPGKDSSCLYFEAVKK